MASTRDGRKPRDVASNDAVRAALEPGRVARISELAPQLRSPRPSQGGAGGPRLSFMQAARQSFSRAVRRSQTGPAGPPTAEAAADADAGGSHRGGEGSHRGGAEGSYSGAPPPRPPRRSCLAASGALQEEPMPPPPAEGGGAETPTPQLQMPPQKKFGK